MGVVRGEGSGIGDGEPVRGMEEAVRCPDGEELELGLLGAGDGEAMGFAVGERAGRGGGWLGERTGVEKLSGLASV